MKIYNEYLVSFQLRLGLAVYIIIVKFRPKHTQEARWYPRTVGYVSLSLAEVTGSILSGHFRFSFLHFEIY